MLLVGLTGGIGSGKSTVARMLERRGALVFDADTFARAAVEPGTPALAAIVDRFGRNVLSEDGSLDRAALAARVFDDAEAREALEAIVHPEVKRRLREAIRPHLETDRVIVYDSPLLIETGRHADVDVVVLVSADPRTQVARLTRDRGMTEAEARARIDAQWPTERKAEVADHLLDNDGTEAELEAQVDRLWPALEDAARSRTREA